MQIRTIEANEVFKLAAWPRITMQSLCISAARIRAGRTDRRWNCFPRRLPRGGLKLR